MNQSMAGIRDQQPVWNWDLSSEPPSRSTTPRASWPLASPVHASDDSAPPRKNPWSTKSSSPPSESRSATPIAPQPVRPVLAPPPVPRTPFTLHPPSPVRSEYGVSVYPARNRDILGPVELSQLILTPSHISDLKLCFPSLLSKQGWDSPTAQLCYIWALKNPKTALLLYMTGNLMNWPIAAIFTPLLDSMMPFNIHMVEGVVGSQAASAVVDMQRRVSICALASGQHVQVKSWEDLPLQQVDVIQSSQKGSGLSEIDKVRWVLDKEERLQVRKRIHCARKAHRAAVESEIKQMRKLKHAGIVSVTASYVQDNTIGILMSPVASCDLAEYLRLPQGTIQTHLLKKWCIDLLGALAYIHSSNLQHRNIRPAKILVNGDHILFSAFGISSDSSSIESGASRSRLYEGDRYIYAAPEAVKSNRRLQSSDVFSLGCVFAEMTTVIKQQTIDHFRTFRTMDGDSSFSANLPKATTWLDGLAVLQRGSSDEMTEESKALSIVKVMIHPDPGRRPKVATLLNSFGDIWHERMDREHSEPSSPYAGGIYTARWNDAAMDDAFFGRGF